MTRAPGPPRTIVVTGASAGLGRALVRVLAADGHRLGLIARGRAGLEGAAADVRAAGGTPLVVPVDVADADAMEAAVARIEDELGPIDAWVSCAMVSVQAPTLDLTADERRRVTEVTYLGALNGIVPVVRRMVARDRGHVVQIGSALGARGAPPLAAYSGAKHALRGFLDALRAELRLRGSAVRVTLVHPPGMNTTHFGWARTRTRGGGRPFPPVAQPEAVARAVRDVLDHPGPPVVAVDVTTPVALALGRLDLPVVGPAATAVIWRALQRRTPPGARDNLHAPLDEHEDHGTHGPFGREARRRLPEARVLRHGRGLLGAGVTAGAALAVARARRAG